MDELVDRLVASVGIDRTAAEKSVGMILDFLSKEGPPEQVKLLIDRLPGADGAIAAASAGESGGGMFGGMGGIMGVGSRMMAAGLSMDQIQGVTRETIAYARAKAGEDVVGEIVGAIPGLSQFV
jgi:hypothetical protein